MKDEVKALEKPPPPEGGWGYFILLSIFLVHLTTVVPTSAFGVLFGEFVASLDNETYGTTMATVTFNTCLFLTGLLSNYLLGKYSFRLVAFGGACLISFSAISVVFTNNLYTFVFFYGVLGGVGAGLMLPAVFSSQNDYFHKKLNLINGLSQVLITISSMVYPLLGAYSIETFGFQGTKIIMAIISTLSFVASWLLHPVEWHVKDLKDNKINGKSQTSTKSSEKPLLSSTESNERGLKQTEVLNPNENENNKMGALQLLQSPKYLNIILGLSLAFSSDTFFLSLLRLVLHNLGFSDVDVAKMSMVLFGCDLLSRVVYVVLSAFFTIKNRYLFFGGTLLTMIFRIVYILRDDYIWRISQLAILGFLRCTIQTTFIIVIAEEYRENFSTAYSIFMVVGGIVGTVLGITMNYVKHFTNGDTMVLHVLTIALAITVISWSVEFMYKLFKKKSS